MSAGGEIRGLGAREQSKLVVKPLGKLEYMALVAAIFGAENSVKIAKQYPVPAHTTDYRDHVSNFSNDALFHCPGRNATLSRETKPDALKTFAPESIAT